MEYPRLVDLDRMGRLSAARRDRRPVRALARRADRLSRLRCPARARARRLVRRDRARGHRRRHCGDRPGALPGRIRDGRRALPLVERSARTWRSEEHTSELQSLMRISYAVFCLKKKTKNNRTKTNTYNTQTNT